MFVWFSGMQKTQIPGHSHLMTVSFSILRLNADKFPVTSFEREAYDRFGLQPKQAEVAGDDILALGAECDAILVVSEPLPADVINGLKRCRAISRMGTGVDRVDCNAATEKGIVVTNVPDFCVEEQADHTMALLLSLVRKLPQMQAAMLAGEYTRGRDESRPIRRFRGRVLGLVGFGASARAVARRASGFGFRIMATRRRWQQADPEAESIGVTLTDLDTVVREADYLSLHLPLNTQTRHLINATRLAEMKSGSFLINTARGAIVDESALVAELKSGRIAAAGLDTFHEINVHGPETPSMHPLLHLENVICTPHVAAFSVESSRDVGTGAVENVAAVLSGRWPRSDRIVNPTVKPRFELVE